MKVDVPFKIEHGPLLAFSVEDNQPIKGEVKVAKMEKYGIICFGPLSETVAAAVCLSDFGPAIAVPNLQHDVRRCTKYRITRNTNLDHQTSSSHLWATPHFGIPPTKALA